MQLQSSSHYEIRKKQSLQLHTFIISAISLLLAFPLKYTYITLRGPDVCHLVVRTNTVCTHTHTQKNIHMPNKCIQQSLFQFYQSQLLANRTSGKFLSSMGIAVIMSHSDNMATPAILSVKNIIIVL